FCCFCVRKVTVRDSTIGDRARDAMNQLAHRSFSSTFVWVGTVRDVAVEVFRNSDFRGERTPVLRDQDIFLLENDLAAVVGDFRVTPFPFDLVKWRNRWIAEYTFDPQATIFLAARFIFSTCRRT